MQIGVLGVGAVGGLISALLWRHGQEISCITTDSGVERIRARGVHLQSSVFGEFRATPQANTVLTAPVDVLFVSVKAPELPRALLRISPALVQDAVIIPLLNGIGHLEALRDALGRGVVAGTIGAVEVYRDEDGTIVHANRHARIELASTLSEYQPRLQKVADLLARCGVEVKIKESEADVTWSKLSRLCAIAATTSAAQRPIGVIRTDAAWRKLLVDSVHEAVLVAEADGVAIDPVAIVRAIDALPAGQLTSLSRDVANGIRGETDAIIGEVIRRAARYQIACPALTGLMQRIGERLKEACL